MVSLAVFPLSHARADTQAPPEMGPVKIHYPPDAGDRRFLDLFFSFDRLYRRRYVMRASLPEEWARMGEKLSAELGIAGDLPSRSGEAWGENLYNAYLRHSETHDVELSFYLRALLMLGESYLFASQGYFDRHDPRFLPCYERGITVLQEILGFVESWTGSSSARRTEAVLLPAYSKGTGSGPLGGRTEYLPHAGFETIGTGFEGSLGVIRRSVSHDPLERYDTLEKYREVLDALDTPVTQIPTTRTARDLLSSFCPWGVGVYFWLKAAGMTEQLDFRILRPYARGLDKNLHEKLMNNLQGLFSSRFHYIDVSEWPPLVSDLSIPTQRIPPMIRARMDCVVDESGCLRTHEEKSAVADREVAFCRDVREAMTGGDAVGTGQGKAAFRSDVIGDLGDRQIRWLWVGDPTYNLWVVSPVLYNWRASDYVNLVFNLYKWANGGPVWGAVSVGMDAAGAKVLDGLFQFFKTSPVPVPLFSNVLTEVAVDRYSTWVQGEPVPIYGTLTAGEWVDGRDLIMDITNTAFGAMETSNRETLFGGIDPGKIDMGRTYDGSPIPPVLLVSNVVGVQDVPDGEYPNQVNVTRFFVMDPNLQGGTAGYDLAERPLLGMKRNDFCIGWSAAGSPLPSVTMATSFAPSGQILTFRLDPETTGLITGADSVKAELWSVTLEDEYKVATAAIRKGNDQFTIDLYNAEQPAVEVRYKQALARHLGGSSFNRHLRAKQGEHHTALVRLRTQYELRLKVNGRVETYPVNLYAGPRGAGREKQPVTGTLSVSSLGPRYQELHYDRVIRIPLGRVEKGSLQRGKPPRSAGDE